ncbi:hypothetical protein BZA77DRAFT_129354 [Pyronema omphalodes]|nr:hypothetical protein BZA77DRAFT_129354 [Pyronema omphalodes]
MTKFIDSHIHLYSQSDNESLAWMTPSNPLAGTFDPARYSSCSSSSNLTGYIFVETDRSYPSPISATADGLKNPLNEISMALEIFTSSNSKLLGMVPFAPLPLGSAGMQSWWDLALKLGDSPAKVEKMIRGVRYLVQDKPRGTLSCPGFVEGITWTLGKGMVFELGVDTRSTGLWQLEEAVQVMRDVLDGGKENGEQKGWVVIDHMAKPDLHASNFHSDRKTAEWLEKLKILARYPNVAVKFSGLFSELDYEFCKGGDVDLIAKKILPWVESIVFVFGAERVIWGSDWPVCNIGYGNMVGQDKADGAWRAWRQVSEKVLEELVKKGSMTEQEKQGVLGEVAARVYRLD